MATGTSSILTSITCAAAYSPDPHFHLTLVFLRRDRKTPKLICWPNFRRIFVSLIRIAPAVCNPINDCRSVGSVCSDKCKHPWPAAQHTQARPLVTNVNRWRHIWGVRYMKAQRENGGVGSGLQPKIMTAAWKKRETPTSRLCRPRLVLGLGCLARSAAPGCPGGSETRLRVVPLEAATVTCSVQKRRWVASHLFDGDSRSPVLVLLQDRQTDSAGWIDIWVEYGWLKLAWVMTI